MAIFELNTWVNPFQKMSIFRLNERPVFIAQKGVFTFWNIIKFPWPLQPEKKKKLEKWLFLDQKHALTSLEKCQFFNFLNFLLLQTRKVFFRCRISSRGFSVLEYRKRHFPYLHCLKKKLEKWLFLHQNHGLTPLEKVQFLDFLNFLFLQPRKAFFRSKIS